MTVIRLPANGFIRWTSEMLFPTLMRIGSWFPYQALHLNLSTHRFFGSSVLPFPYGIDVNPKDGSIWYAKLYASKIGRIDPKTLTRDRVGYTYAGTAPPALRRRWHSVDPGF